jgi:hypothetical protein
MVVEHSLQSVGTTEARTYLETLELALGELSRRTEQNIELIISHLDRIA